MIVDDSFAQGSQEWHDSKLARPSSSNFGRIITPSGGKSSSFDGYLGELAAEYITKSPQSDYVSDDMILGLEFESLARSLYQDATGNTVREVGIVYRCEKRRVACSPDGLKCDGFDVRGGVEIKSPKLSNHIGYVISGVVPGKYKPQVQGSILICDTDHWDFMSYSPLYQPLIVRSERDDAFTKKLDSLLIEFCDRLDEMKSYIDSRNEF